MSQDALQPRQFGKFTTQPMRGGGRGVEAYRGKRKVGAMVWESPLPESAPSVGKVSKAGLPIESGKPTIFKVVVSEPYRRQGVATAMLNHARDLAPGLQHGFALSDDGAAWAKARP